MELVQTPLDPLNVFATMDTLETDATVQVEYNFKLLLPLWQKSRIFCEIVGLQRLQRLRGTKRTNGQIHTRVSMTIITLIADFVVFCLFTLLTRTDGGKIETTLRKTQCPVSKVLQRYIKELKLTALLVLTK